MTKAFSDNNCWKLMFMQAFQSLANRYSKLIIQIAKCRKIKLLYFFGDWLFNESAWIISREVELTIDKWSSDDNLQKFYEI